MNGVTSSVGCDIVSSNGGDLLGQVRLGLQDARAQANDEWIAAGGMARTLEITAADALGWATTGGAKALGLENKIGVIGPGKKADLIVVRPGEPNLWPLPASEGGVALHVHPADISDVMINGVFVKTDGRLADVDYEKEFAIAQRSRADFMSRVLARSGVLLPPEDATSLASLEETAIANLAS
jgi:cytosine/adenosine deaminase-related metal-dependent hydrolase